MADNEVISFDIIGNIDTTNLEKAAEYVRQIENETRNATASIREMNSGMSTMANTSEMFSNNLRGCNNTADLLGRKISEANELIKSGADESVISERLAQINDMARDVDTMHKLTTGGGEYDVSGAKSILSTLSRDVAATFDKLIPMIATSIRGKLTSTTMEGKLASVYNTASPEFKQVRDMLGQMQRASQSGGAPGLSDADMRTIMKGIIASTTPMYRSGEYGKLRFGGVGVSYSKTFDSPDDILPGIFKGTHASGQDFKYKSNESIKGTLTKDAAIRLMNLIASNKIAGQAALESGLVNQNGLNFSFTQNGKSKGVTQAAVGKFAEALYRQAKMRSSGLVDGVKPEEYYSTDYGVIKRITDGLVNGSGSEAVSAMSVLDEIIDKSNFTGSGKSFNASGISQRIDDIYKKSYIIPRHNVFGKKTSSQVAINESRLTDMISKAGVNLSDRGATDALMEISLADYDPDNAAQVQKFEELVNKGYGDGKYRYHSIHGTGDATTMRFIRSDVADAINKQYSGFAKKHGLAGDEVLRLFSPLGEVSGSTFGKVNDAMGKLWTDSVRLDKGVDDKTFGVVDLSRMENGKWTEYANGMNILLSSVMDTANQTRFALAGKGSNTVIDGNRYKTIGEFAKATGLIGKDATSFYLPGLRAEAYAKEHDDFSIDEINSGKKTKKEIEDLVKQGVITDVYNVTGGLINASTLKDKAMLGNITDSRRVDQIYTDAIREFGGFRSVSDYELENDDASSLGLQLSGYLHLSDRSKDAQVAYATKVLNELNTIEGIRKYVFSGKNDFLSQQVNDPENGAQFAATNKQVQQRVDRFRSAFLDSVMGGNVFNLNDDNISITQARALANPLAALIQTSGSISDDTYEKLNKLVKKDDGSDYSREEMVDLLSLKNGMVDFNLKGGQEVGVARSPSAYGGLVVRKNLADVLRPIYEAYGLSTTGTYLNLEDMDNLQGMDLDGDRVKLVTGAIVEDFKKTIEDYNLSLGDFDDQYTLRKREAEAPEGGWGFGNEAKSAAKVAKRSKEAVYLMGVGSDIGTRLTQFNLNDADNQPLALLANRAFGTYDYATTYQKKIDELVDKSTPYLGLTPGHEFAKFPAKLKSVYDVKYVKDENGGHYETGDGTVINDVRKIGDRNVNWDLLKRIDVNSVNLPSMYRSSNIMAREAGMDLYNRGLISDERSNGFVALLTEAAKAREEERAKKNSALVLGENSAAYKLMMNRAGIFGQMAGNTRFGISEEEEDILSKQLFAAQQEIAAAVAARNGQFGFETEDGKVIKDAPQYEAYLKKAYGIGLAQQMLDQYEVDIGNGNTRTVGLGLTKHAQELIHGNTGYNFGTTNGVRLNNTDTDALTEKDIAKHQEELARKRSIHLTENDIQRTEQQIKDDKTIEAAQAEAARRRKNENHLYSWSELNLLRKGEYAAWYDQHVKEQKITNEAIEQGLAFHRVAEEYENKFIGQELKRGLDEGYLSDDRYEWFNNNFIKAMNEGKQIDYNTKKFDFAAEFTRDLAERYARRGKKISLQDGQKIKDATDAFYTMLEGGFAGGNGLENEKIIASEGEFLDSLPDGFRYKGIFDLVTEDKDGNLILSDFKPTTSYEGVREQMLAYAYYFNKEKKKLAELEGKEYGKGEYRGISKIRALGYKDKAAITFDYSEEEAEKIVNELNDLAVEADMFRNLGLGRNDVDFFTKVKASKIRAANKSDLNFYNAYKTEENREEMNKGTGVGIGVGIKLQQTIDDYNRETDDLLSRAENKSRIKDKNYIPNMWSSLDYRFNGGFDKYYKEVEGMGASEATLEQMKARNKVDKDNYNSALRKASVDSFTNFIGQMDRLDEQNGVSKGVRTQIEQIEQLERAYREASQAVEELIKKQESYKTSVELDDSQKAEMALNEASLKTAQEQQKKAQEVKDKKIAELNKKKAASQEIFDYEQRSQLEKQIDNTYRLSGQRISPIDRINRTIEDEKARIAIERDSLILNTELSDAQKKSIRDQLDKQEAIVESGRYKEQIRNEEFARGFQKKYNEYTQTKNIERDSYRLSGMQYDSLDHIDDEVMKERRRLFAEIYANKANTDISESERAARTKELRKQLKYIDDGTYRDVLMRNKDVRDAHAARANFNELIGQEDNTTRMSGLETDRNTRIRRAEEAERLRIDEEKKKLDAYKPKDKDDEARVDALRKQLESQETLLTNGTFANTLNAIENVNTSVRDYKQYAGRIELENNKYRLSGEVYNRRSHIDEQVEAEKLRLNAEIGKNLQDKSITPEERTERNRILNEQLSLVENGTYKNTLQQQLDRQFNDRLYSFQRAENSERGNLLMGADRINFNGQMRKDAIDHELKLLERDKGAYSEDEYNKLKTSLENRKTTINEDVARQLSNYTNQINTNDIIWQAQQDRQMRQFDLRQQRQNMQYLTGFGSRSIRNAFENKEYYSDFVANKQNEITSLKSQQDALKDSNGNILDQAKFDSLGKRIATLNEELEKGKAALSQYGGAGAVVNGVFAELGVTLTNVINRFGRQMFQKALQEAKNFVKQFDSEMNQIQSITLKSDSDMLKVRSNTINKAINLKTSVSNVAQTEAALYRQGLTDSEVDSRTDAIIKFSTVTGAKVTNATKALTTAIQSGLVNSVEEAMDALVALGDSAATTAEEIFKGMQKSAAAAENAGMTYGELTALITVGVEKTQLGGRQIGTVINSMLSRMRKVTTDGYVTDESGESIGINDVEKSLALAGVQLRTYEGSEEFRSATDVLRDLAKVWNELSDLQKSNVTYALAATRGQNVFQSLMEGMSEDGAFEEYLSIAENSEGITDDKYAIAIQSINASLQELRSTFDGLVESLTSSGIITGLLDVVTGFVDGLRNLANLGTPVVTAMTIIGAAIAALAVKILIATSAAKTALNPVAGLLGLAAGATVLAVGSFVGNSMSASNVDQRQIDRAENLSRIDNYIDYRNDKLSNAKEGYKNMQDLYDKYKDGSMPITTSDNKAFYESFRQVAKVFPTLRDEVLHATDDIKKWAESITNAKEEFDNYNVESAKEAYKVAKGEINDIKVDYGKTISDIENSADLNGMDIYSLVMTGSKSTKGEKNLLNTLLGEGSFDEKWKAATSTLGYSIFGLGPMDEAKNLYNKKDRTEQDEAEIIRMFSEYLARTMFNGEILWGNKNGDFYKYLDTIFGDQAVNWFDSENNKEYEFSSSADLPTNTAELRDNVVGILFDEIASRLSNGIYTYKTHEDQEKEALDAYKQLAFDTVSPIFGAIGVPEFLINGYFKDTYMENDTIASFDSVFSDIFANYMKDGRFDTDKYVSEKSIALDEDEVELIVPDTIGSVAESVYKNGKFKTNGMQEAYIDLYKTILSNKDWINQEPTQNIQKLFEADTQLNAMVEDIKRTTEKEEGYTSKGYNSTDVENYMFNKMYGTNYRDFNNEMVRFDDMFGNNAIKDMLAGTYTFSDTEALLSNEALLNYIKSFESGAAVIEALKDPAADVSKAFKNLAEEISSELINDMSIFGDETENVLKIMSEYRNGMRGEYSARKGMNEGIASIKNEQLIIEEFRKGNLTKDIVEGISSITGYSVDKIISGAYNKDIESLLLLKEDINYQDASNYVNGLELAKGVSQALSDYGLGTGVWNLSEILKIEDIDDSLRTEIEGLQRIFKLLGFDGIFNVSENANSGKNDVVFEATGIKTADYTIREMMENALTSTVNPYMHLYKLFKNNDDIYELKGQQDWFDALIKSDEELYSMLENSHEGFKGYNKADLEAYLFSKAYGVNHVNYENEMARFDEVFGKGSLYKMMRGEYSANDILVDSFDNRDALVGFLKQFSVGADLIDKIENGADNLEDEFKELAVEISTTLISNIEMFGESTEEVVKIITEYKSGLAGMIEVQRGMNESIASGRGSQYYIDQYREGARSNSILEQISSMTGIEMPVLKYADFDMVNKMLSMVEEKNLQDVGTYINGIATSELITKELNDFIGVSGISAGSYSIEDILSGLDDGELKNKLRQLALLSEMLGVSTEYVIDENKKEGTFRATSFNTKDTTTSGRLDDSNYEDINPYEKLYYSFLMNRNGDFWNVRQEDYFDELIRSDSTLQALMDNVENGRHGYTMDDLDEYLFNKVYGTDYQDYGSEMNRFYGYFGDDTLHAMQEGDYDYSGLNFEELQDNEALMSFIMSFENGKQVIEDMMNGSDHLKESLAELAKEMSVDLVEAERRFGNEAKAVIGVMEEYKTGLRGVAKTRSDLNKIITDANDDKYFMDKYRAGDRDDETIQAVSKMTNRGYGEVKDAKGDILDNIFRDLDLQEIISIQDIENQVMGMAEGADIISAIEKSINDGLMDGFIAIPGGAVTLDFTQVMDMLDEQTALAMYQIISDLQQKGIEFSLDAITGQDGVTKVGFNVTNLKKGGARSSKPSGGGGGGKSKSEKLIDKLKKNLEITNHRIKMIRYQETKYQNADELGNYGLMLETENEAQKDLANILEDNIGQLKEQMTKVKEGSDDWFALREAVLDYEEQLEQANIDIEENTKKIKENEQAILKLHTDLEGMVKSEIEARIQRERNENSAYVEMSNTILEAVKKRYQDEWDLIKKDIDKKKEALDEEKQLIDERLQRRKNAEDEAEKYERLAEYKKQLALISMDSTRTKDATELRKKIADLEKEIAWDVAEEEAEAQKKELEDIANGYDDYVTNGDEDLEYLLEDANNFADEVTNILGMSHDDLMDWLKSNVDEYIKSLDDARQQMVYGWEDTYKQMYNIVDVYWDEINDILSSKNSFLEYMKQSEQWMTASIDEQLQLLYQWGDAFDKWRAAQKKDAEYDHDDDTMAAYKYQPSGSGSGSGSGSASSGYNNGGVSSENVKALQSYLGVTVDGKFGPNTLAAAKAKFGSGVTDAASAYAEYEKRKLSASSGRGASNTNYSSNRSSFSVNAYAEGGLVDFTGPAWVDGTKTKPEAFLSADDTAMIRAMLDAAKYISVRPYISSFDPTTTTANNNSIGNVNVTINQAELKEDADFEKVAQRVGEAFTKELSKQGFGTASFSF